MNTFELIIFYIGIFTIACCIGVTCSAIASLGSTFGKFLSRKELKR